MDKARNILLIIADPALSEAVSKLLADGGYAVVKSDQCGLGVDLLQKNDISTVISDLGNECLQGSSCFNAIRKKDKNLEIIIIDKTLDAATILASFRKGAFDVLIEPLNGDELVRAVKGAVDSYDDKNVVALLNENITRTYIELEKLKDTLEEKVMERTEALALSEKKVRDIIDNSFDPILTLNDAFDITGWNKGAELTFGYHELEIIDKPFDLLLDGNVAEAKAIIRAAIDRDGYVRNHIVQCLTKHRMPIFVNITASRLGQNRMSFIIRDISREKKVQQMKNDFVSNVSHELRTPLTSIKGAIELLLSGSEGPMTESQVSFLSIVRNNSLRLIRLINDLLDLSKMESGKMKMEFRNGDLNEIVREMLKDLEPLAAKQTIKLVAELDPAVGEVLFDEDRIRQVITNLIGNALKFTPPNGTVTVSTQQRPTELEICVKDTGIGIPSDKFEMVFEKFQQVDSSTTRAKGGTGLGLAITKAIIEAHKGRIWIESEVGKGTSFLVALPSRPAETPRAPAKGIASAPGAVPTGQAAPGKTFTVKNILIVENDPDLAKVLTAHLSKEGYVITVLGSSADALKAAIDLRPQLITIDITMPTVDGYTLAEMIKKNPETKDIPIVIISTLPENEKAYRLGITDYLIKPFETGDLLARIKEIELQKTGEMQKKKILVVDDDPDISTVVTFSLKEHNYQIINAYNGLQAINVAKSEMPDVILLDLMMPEMNGFEVIQMLKADPVTKDIPVLVITGRSTEDLRKAIQLGAREYLVKPFTINILLGEIDKILKREHIL